VAATFFAVFLEAAAFPERCGAVRFVAAVLRPEVLPRLVGLIGFSPIVKCDVRVPELFSSKRKLYAR
jgi:hypothetical protein